MGGWVGGEEGEGDVPNMLEGLLDKLTDGVGLSRGEDEVVGGVVLEHHPHAPHVVTGVAPVTLGVLYRKRWVGG